MVFVIEKVIMEFELGFNFVMVGENICILILLLIEECCCDMVKMVKGEGENVKVVLINIFGGIVSCVIIAEGIIGAV